MKASAPPESDMIVSEARIKRLLNSAKRGVAVWKVFTDEGRAEMVSIFEELLRHRQLEHDNYWGDDTRGENP